MNFRAAALLGGQLITTQALGLEVATKMARDLHEQCGLRAWVERFDPLSIRWVAVEDQECKSRTGGSFTERRAD